MSGIDAWFCLCCAIGFEFWGRSSFKNIENQVSDRLMMTTCAALPTPRIGYRLRNSSITTANHGLAMML